MQNKINKWVLIAALVFCSTTLLLLFKPFYDKFIVDFMQPFSGVHDVSSRLESPDGQKVAVLIRNYGFDLNFQLYIFENYFVQPPYAPNDSLWLSSDYNPDDWSKNLHEDLEWSKDSSVVAVTIDGKYVFAYYFKSGKKIEDQGSIMQLLESRNSIE